MIARRPAAVRLRHGEVLLWQGVPDWRALARHVVHTRVIVGYFVLLQVDSIVTVIARSMPLADAVRAEARLFLLASFTVGLCLLLAWLMARTTQYTLTTERVVLRYGLALPATLSVPMAAIEQVGVRINHDRRGDVAITPRVGNSLTYIKLWPHARPWRLSRPQPMLRCLPDAAVAGAILSRLLAARDDDLRRAAEPDMQAAD